MFSTRAKVYGGGRNNKKISLYSRYKATNSDHNRKNRATIHKTTPQICAHILENVYGSVALSGRVLTKRVTFRVLHLGDKVKFASSYIIDDGYLNRIVSDLTVCVSSKAYVDLPVR